MACFSNDTDLMLHITRLAAAFASLAVLAPLSPHVVADAQRPTSPERFDRADLQRLHKHENFDLLRAIERLLIVGRLEEAKRFAAAITGSNVVQPAP